MKFGFFSSEFSDQGTADDGWFLYKSPANWALFSNSKSETSSFVAGALLSILSTLILLVGNVVAFCIIYSCGNIISLFSLTFVVGIPKQIKTMFAPVRFWATIIYISLLALTLAMSIWLKNFALSIVLVCVQFAALVWYS
ncbi:hypothetical protein [Parasitella parasitica]|uniref:Protein transport protein SFT2 n=1 Tax=Parasitella parasitica TaxID=35722 RepID=A0A0B7NWM2_9FUNG|nr:hypothetical protein [Parasitella parasitica]